MNDLELSEIIQSIPHAFWKSFAFQQINKRKDLKQPRWSILVNETGVQVCPRDKPRDNHDHVTHLCLIIVFVFKSTCPCLGSNTNFNDPYSHDLES